MLIKQLIMLLQLIVKKTVNMRFTINTFISLNECA